MKATIATMLKLKRYFQFAIVSFAMLCWLLFGSLPVSADGGAPNLAYVSGTAEGISAIDISQQKVTNTLALTGDPHTILLSVNGRLLYVTQPDLGQVAVIAAKTKLYPALFSLTPQQAAGINILSFLLHYGVVPTIYGFAYPYLSQAIAARVV